LKERVDVFEQIGFYFVTIPVMYVLVVILLGLGISALFSDHPDKINLFMRGRIRVYYCTNRFFINKSRKNPRS